MDGRSRLGPLQERQFALLYAAPVAPERTEQRRSFFADLAGGWAGVSMALFSAMWETTLQREVPEDKLSRVSSYDWMGSIAFLPAGYALAGPMMVVTRDVRELRGRPAPSRRPERMAA